MTEGEVSLRPAKRLGLFDEFKILRDWRIDSDVFLERCEVEEGLLLFERRKVVADCPCASGHLPLDFLLYLFKSSAKVSRLSGEVLVVGPEGHADLFGGCGRRLVALCYLTLALRRRQRHEARPRPQKMYIEPVAGAWRHAVGAPLERGVRRHLAHDQQYGIHRLSQWRVLGSERNVIIFRMDRAPIVEDGPQYCLGYEHLGSIEGHSWRSVKSVPNLHGLADASAERIVILSSDEAIRWPSVWRGNRWFIPRLFDGEGSFAIWSSSRSARRLWHGGVGIRFV